jgi:hypothetical protein
MLVAAIEAKRDVVIHVTGVKDAKREQALILLRETIEGATKSNKLALVGKVSHNLEFGKTANDLAYDVEIANKTADKGALTAKITTSHVLRRTILNTLVGAVATVVGATKLTAVKGNTNRENTATATDDIGSKNSFEDKVARESLSGDKALVNSSDIALRGGLREGHSLLVNPLILAHNFTNKGRKNRVKFAIVVDNLGGNLRDKLVVERDNKFVFYFCRNGSIFGSKSDIDVLAGSSSHV